MKLKLKSVHTTIFAIISMAGICYLAYETVLDGPAFVVCFMGLLGLMGYRKKLNSQNGEKEDGI